MKLSPARQKKFLEALKETKMNVTAAARKSGLTSPVACYMQRKADPDFAEQWADIETELIDALEEQEFRDAKRASADRHWVLARRRPERWAQKRQTAIDGVIEHRHEIRDMTDKELMAIVAKGVEEGSIDPEWKALIDDEALR